MLVGNFFFCWILVLYSGIFLIEGSGDIVIFVGVILGSVCVIILLKEFLCKFFSNVIIFSVLDICVFFFIIND